MSALSTPVVVEEESATGLIRQRWVFCLLGPRILLDRYHYERRRSKSQDFRTVKFYDRERQDGEDYGDWTWLTEDEVPWDDDLKGQVLAKLVEHLVVGRLSDFAGQ